MEKTINAIDSAPLDTKFENSRKEIINILKTNESPTEKINNINQLMNHTDFTEEEQVQFYKTLTDAVMSSKNS
ncbi:Hypothetical protein SRAE_2000200400 [Strongyloides ratti]|uniref:Uncharacterized protein n=1 Tax=Strongyloides ratti TaxID=34506 RepID=A0A090LIM2_STRRB|nr:Hypothetical protein SRAE_2000200400 [Strongyloides ratti]CEF67340.1 Hypothetical protein SRAE_2000200400 [Strongyloides ratti]